MLHLQDLSALFARMTVLNPAAEPLRIHGEACNADKMSDLMRSVGLDPRFLTAIRIPFSGGQRQRIGIAARWHSTRI